MQAAIYPPSRRCKQTRTQANTQTDKQTGGHYLQVSKQLEIKTERNRKGDTHTDACSLEPAAWLAVDFFKKGGRN